MDVWLAIKTLAALLEDGRDQTVLDTLEGQLRAMPSEKRMSLDNEIAVIVAQLARLNMRLRT